MPTVVLALKDGRDRAKFLDDLRIAGYTAHGVQGLRRHVDIEDASVATLPDQIKHDPLVEAISDGDASVKPSDQSFTIDASLTDGSWPLTRIIRRTAPWNVNRIWLPRRSYFRSVRDGSGVDYYHLDTGIRSTHDEFGGRVTNIYEYASSGGLGDDFGHGTITASCAAGATCGIARGANIFGVKISISNAGVSTDAALVASIGALLDHYDGRSAPAVANLSFSPAFGTASASAVKDLIDAGIVFCICTGNDGVSLTSPPFYLANVADAVVVGGHGMADIPQWFARDDGSMSKTSYGALVDILAPGQHVRAAFNTGDANYARSSGSTSCATAYTAGVVACMLQGHSRLTGRSQVQAVVSKLLANATAGKLRSAFGFTLPDKLLYLDPNQTAPETISGL